LLIRIEFLWLPKLCQFKVFLTAGVSNNAEVWEQSTHPLEILTIGVWRFLHIFKTVNAFRHILIQILA